MMSFSRIEQDADVSASANNYYNHPFNIALLHGSLSDKAFLTYVEQDALYLQDFSQALQKVYQRLDQMQHREKFENFVKDTIAFESGLRKQYLSNRKDDTSPPKKNPATREYTEHLLATTENGSIGEAIACLLPCFWLYCKLGKQMSSSPHYNKKNPYYEWIATYADKGFNASTQAIIEVFNETTRGISQDKQQKVKAAFIKSSVCEFRFLDTIFTLSPNDFAGLDELDKQFEAYQYQFGTHKPFHADWKNTLASCIGVKINQERVKEGRQLIATAQAAARAHPTDQAGIIEKTLKDLQSLHAAIIKETYTGKTTDYITATLNRYGYKLQPKPSFRLFASHKPGVWIPPTALTSLALTTSLTSNANARQSPVQAMTR